MGDIGKSRFPADLCNTVVCLQEFPLGIHDPCYIQILDNGGVRMFFKLSAEIIGAEIKSLG